MNRCAISVLLLTFVAPVAVFAQDLSDLELRNVTLAVEPWIVRLSATGTLDGKDVLTEKGTGFLFRSTPTKVMTARHVVREDKEFDADPNKPGEFQRRVSIARLSNGVIEHIPAVRAVRNHPSRDVAEIYVNLATERALRLDSTPTTAGQSVIVYSWPAESEVIRPKVTRLLPSQASDAPYVRLDHEFASSESGSPVVNKRGLVVAVLSRRAVRVGDRGYSLALPVAEFKDWITDSTASITTAAAQQEREEALKLFNGVLAEIRKTKMVNGELVFPSLQKYMSSPTIENWEIVKRSVATSLKQITTGIELAYTYDAQLRLAAEPVSSLVGATEKDLVDRAYSNTFKEVRAVWNGRSNVQQTILAQTSLPTVEQVALWKAQLQIHYQRLDKELTRFVQVLVAQR